MPTSWGVLMRRALTRPPWPFSQVRAGFRNAETFWREATRVPGMTAHHADLTQFFARQLLGVMAPAALPEAPTRNSAADRISSAVGLTFLAVVAINAVMIVFLEGFAWVLPDNPTGYALFGH